MNFGHSFWYIGDLPHIETWPESGSRRLCPQQSQTGSAAQAAPRWRNRMVQIHHFFPTEMGNPLVLFQVFCDFFRTLACFFGLPPLDVLISRIWVWTELPWISQAWVAPAKRGPETLVQGNRKHNCRKKSGSCNLDASTSCSESCLVVTSCWIWVKSLIFKTAGTSWGCLIDLQQTSIHITKGQSILQILFLNLLMYPWWS